MSMTAGLLAADVVLSQLFFTILSQPTIYNVFTGSEYPQLKFCQLKICDQLYNRTTEANTLNYLFEAVRAPFGRNYTITHNEPEDHVETEADASKTGAASTKSEITSTIIEKPPQESEHASTLIPSMKEWVPMNFSMGTSEVFQKFWETMIYGPWTREETLIDLSEPVKNESLPCNRLSRAMKKIDTAIGKINIRDTIATAAAYLLTVMSSLGSFVSGVFGPLWDLFVSCIRCMFNLRRWIYQELSTINIDWSSRYTSPLEGRVGIPPYFWRYFNHIVMPAAFIVAITITGLTLLGYHIKFPSSGKTDPTPGDQSEASQDKSEKEKNEVQGTPSETAGEKSTLPEAVAPEIPRDESKPQSPKPKVIPATDITLPGSYTQSPTTPGFGEGFGASDFESEPPTPTSLASPTGENADANAGAPKKKNKNKHNNRKKKGNKAPEERDAQGEASGPGAAAPPTAKAPQQAGQTPQEQPAQKSTPEGGAAQDKQDEGKWKDEEAPGSTSFLSRFNPFKGKARKD